MRGKTNLLAEARRLYDAGWGVHWLHPRQKRPLGSWKADERVEWALLKRDYRDDLNVGVKLGEASHLATGYLACLDCDVKSDDPAHRVEMEARLAELYPDLGSAPTVTSGRGLGSRHIYGVTATPSPYLILSQSKDQARVKMPSVKPSRNEENVLSAADLAAGWRLRPAWEITLMGKGRQMALPPSIHPDSGKRYVWDRPFTSATDLPALDPRPGVGGMPAKVATPPKDDFRFTATPVDLYMDPRISTGMHALIEDADGVTDQSAALFKACRLMTGAGLSQDEILTVLTDPENALGQCAYRHVQKPVDLAHRERAAYWLWKYTLAKTRADRDFEAVVDEQPPVPELSDAEADEQEAALVGDGGGDGSGGGGGPWELRLERSGPNGEGRPKTTLQNVVMILENAVGRLVFRKNLFTLLQEHGMVTPWGGVVGSEITNGDLVAIKLWMSVHFRCEPPVALVNEAIESIAAANAYHPVRDYLRGLEWDGVPRIHSWLKTYLNADAPEPYLSAVSRKVLCAMVARVMDPGVKFDCVLILEGGQGVGKSTSIRKLTGDDWFSDAQIDIKDKDAVMAMRGVWAVEMGELSSLKKSDVDSLKEFLSRKTDRIRVPYGHRVEAFPRQSVFIGTTNSSEYFRDLTGNRRFWPVNVGNCDWDGLASVRDQLFAETMLYHGIEELYLDDKEAQAGASAEQEKRLVVDAWGEMIENFFENLESQVPGERRFNPDCFTMSDLFGDHGPFAGVRMTQADQNRAGACLRKSGYERMVRWTDKKPKRFWVRVPREAKTA